MSVSEIQASRKKRHRGYIETYKPSAKTRDLLDQAPAGIGEVVTKPPVSRLRLVVPVRTDQAIENLT
ncbi:MAG: hypothetical protein AAFN80_15880, partial [Pseudomonadota bacterium]